MGCGEMSPEAYTEFLSAFLRQAANHSVEGALAYVFGLQGEHSLGLNVGANIYGAASGGDIDPALVHLDQAATVVTVAVAYQFRFATPFGMGPIISLE